MSQFDAVVSFYLSNYVLPIILFALTLMVFAKYQKSLRWKCYAWFFSRFVRGYNESMDSIKADLFKELQNFKSLDRDLRNKGLIRILEIGVGSGCNFKYFPKNARVVCVDPNPHFTKYMEENRNKFPGICLERFILGYGENLAEIKDDTIDVVITTLVMCCVGDIHAVLREIKRVLAPGGRYFFVEHQLGEPGTWYRILQKLLNPVWPYLLDGCELTREISKIIVEAGFAKVDYRTFLSPFNLWVAKVIAPHVAGVACK